VQGEITSIITLREEWEELSEDVVGTIIVGDLNIHHKKWLRRSSRNSAEGEELHRFCLDAGMQQLVRGATREQYLLDLVLTDVEDAKCKILPEIADHCCVLVYFDLPIPEATVQERQVWRYAKADWEGMKAEFEVFDWSSLSRSSVDSAADAMTKDILQVAEKYIPRATQKEKKSTHPWVNHRVEELVEKKKVAAGTSEAKAARDACSTGIREEFKKYVEKEKQRLEDEPKASKGWWSMTRRLLKQRGRVCSIPALREEGGRWCFDAKSKADHLAKTFKSKYELGEPATNYYTEIGVPYYGCQQALAEVTEERAERILTGLRTDSATGPDNLPTRILKECAKQLAKPFSTLAKRILKEGRWPEAWMIHWIVPLHKRNNVFLAGNYRGVHLTAQLSKAMERLLRTLFMPFLLINEVFGPNQFAYIPERGARDAMAHMVLVWISAVAKGRKVAIYCSDVSGAFDRVCLDRLAKKLRAKKIHPILVAVMISWLRTRRAKVVVGGKASEDFKLENMVFQGTVWGPTLWNIFFEDARDAVNEMSFKEVVYADDLNAHREFPGTTKNDIILKSSMRCQEELHAWGKANQVEFDPGKESFHILAGSGAFGGEFKLLGVNFDPTLTMKSALNDVVTEAGWKLKMLIKTRRFYTDAELVMLYKTNLLSYLEYRTPAIYHATRDHLSRLDRVQTKFLQDVGINEVEALMEFNLAPLAVRRDIAMLGLIHRAALGKGPQHFRQHFKVISPGCLKDPREELKGGLATRSPLGLVAVYNMIPGACKKLHKVNFFQAALQKYVKEAACGGYDDWKQMLSPRIPLGRHPVKELGRKVA
jgi:hypothetical protein